ncbi:phenazine biosynthesis FMN-dependent oxidase PhzG [Streptomyces sp. NPDC002671]
MSSILESLTGTVGLPFPEYDTPPPAPMGLARQWTADAVERGVREPMALSLATADRAGRVSNRIVQVIEVADSGLLFTTHSTSRKGRELAENAWASGLFYWRETAQQLCVSGPVVRLDDAENERLWYAREPGLHSMTTASRQSETLDDPQRLLADNQRYAAAPAPLPRPQRFVGYRLTPDSVEFWSAAKTRLHHRLRYEKTSAGWHVVRLQP